VGLISEVNVMTSMPSLSCQAYSAVNIDCPSLQETEGTDNRTQH